MAKKKNRIQSISKIEIKGFKSFKDECQIEIKPLTILSGSNSSGKSSIFQPILMMKQTLNEIYDPGALQLNGPNVKFTKSDQIITKNSAEQEFYIAIHEASDNWIGLTYQKKDNKTGFEIKSMIVNSEESSILIEPDLIIADKDSKLLSNLPDYLLELMSNESFEIKPRISRERCFLEMELVEQGSNISVLSRSFAGSIEDQIRDIIHLPGLRGNPERNYPVTAIDFDKMKFSGTFEKYVASIIANWIDTKNQKILKKLTSYLKRLNLASRIETKYISDTELELYVSRFNESSKEDMVSIADVGLGVSQTLPILVALLIAKKGQIVYIEQPEIHLHPKAQYELSSIFSEAINRGVILIIETHSSVLLRGIQTSIANSNISHDEVALHWFLRNPETGYSFVKSAELDENGAFGDWPEDFDDTNMSVESNYLNAVEKRLFENV